ncbi:uncharacterized protein LY89DRAFT_671378 [Mollisia scopiformis]|uniref:Mid2 domain-containing protein n=1 Tax=Mollisia scopiformis TaxID=149040 RepID=A0A194X4J4_MOLSC|nr:uncharacterized protein LY89DRAFT_671378 [Mollisia scopiformis]KUJ14984.1 hypothetical protein LY89DRAFT_671378 [Mollisia scopiformis]
MKSYHIFFFLVAARSVVAADSTTCYYPDGVTTEPNHVPCNTTLSTSACCDPLDSCTTSGLCLGRTGFNYRGSCTDKTWTSDNCASGCHSDPFTKDAYDTFTPLWSCDVAGAFQADYCCNSPNRNCCTIATFAYGTTGEAFRPGMDQMLLTLASINASAPVTVTVTATAGLASQTGSSNGSSSSSSNIGTAVGAGVGVPLGILAVGILGFLFYRERRHSQQAGSRSNIMEMDPSKTYYQQPPPPPPPPPPQPPYVPFVEAQGQSPISQSVTLAPQSRRMSTQKSPAFESRPSDVHELI